MPAMQQILSMMMFATVEMHMTDPGRLAFNAAMAQEVASKYNATVDAVAVGPDPPIQYAYHGPLSLEHYWNMANTHDIVMILAGVVKKMTIDENINKFLATPTNRTTRNDLIASYLSTKTIGPPEYDLAMSADASFVMNDCGDRLENYYIHSMVVKTLDNITRQLTVKW